MQSLMFFFEPVIWLVFFALCFYLTGKALIVILFKIPVRSATFFLSSVTGMCFVIMGMFLLLTLSALSATSALALSLLPAVLAVTYRPAIYKIQWNELNLRKHYALIALLLAFWFSVAIRVFLPESGADALSYHLPYAKSFANEGDLVLEPFLRYPLNTLNFDLLFSLGFLFEGETLARMFSMYAAFLMVIGTYSLALVFFNAYVATIASWMFISSQIILNIMNTAYIDIGFALFAFAAVYALLIYQKENDTQWLPLIAVFLGITMGTKYLGILVVPSVLFWLFFIVKDKKRWVVCTLLTLVLASPWYIRNILIAGNPIHPFAQSVFGYWLWTPTDMIHQNNDLFSLHGVERNWLNLLKLPWLIWKDTFVRIAPTNDLFILSIPLTLLGLTKPGMVRQLSLFLLFHVIFWFYSSQIMRYLIFALPFLSLLTAFYIYQFFHKITTRIHTQKKPSKRFKPLTQHIIGLVFIVICLYSAGSYHYKTITLGMVPSSHSQWQNMLQNNPDYQLANMANKQQGKTTMKLGFSNVAHYFEYELKGDYFGAANMVEFSNHATSEQLVWEQMKSLNASLLLIDKSIKKFAQVHHLIKNSDRFRLVFENKRGYLYALN